MKDVNISVELEFVVPVDADVENVMSQIYHFMSSYSHLLGFSQVLLHNRDEINDGGNL